MRFKEAQKFACYCQPNLACTCPRYVGCQPFEHVAGQLVAVEPQLLARRTQQAWSRRPRALPPVPRDESRSGEGIVTRGGLVRLAEGHQPVQIVRMHQISTVRRTYLSISRVRVEHVGEELARACDPCNYQTMNIVTINDKELR